MAHSHSGRRGGTLKAGPRLCDSKGPDPTRGGSAMPDHDHDHDHSELSDIQLRVRALETILTEKGYVDPAALDLIVEGYETKIGPKNGALLVARAWIDPDFKSALIADATKAANSLGHV